MLKERPFPFPSDKSIRVIIDTDCYNECDDQFCVAHALMTPKFDIKAIIAAQFGGVYGRKGTEQESYDEIVNIVHLMGLDGQVNILHGSDDQIVDREHYTVSEGAEFIVREAMSDDPRPLFVATLGAVTNLATAILMKPEIVDRMTVVAIIGSPYPKGGFEFNQNNDMKAAEILYTAGAKLWQVPSNVYTTMKFSYYEMLNRVYPCGEVGKYMVKHAMEFAAKMAEIMALPPENNPIAAMMADGDPDMAPTLGGELWSLGDSPTVGIMMNPTVGRFHKEPAPCGLKGFGDYDFSQPGKGQIRVYDDIDARFILNDMCEKLKYNFGE